MKKPKLNNELGNFIVPGVILLPFGILVLGIIVLLFWSADIETKASLGDSFGIINAIFSALAFAVILYTLHLQQQDLHATILELQETRIQNEGHYNTMSLQRFETTFFNLLEMLHTYIMNVEENTYKGFAFFHIHCFHTPENSKWTLFFDHTAKQLASRIISILKFIEMQDFGYSEFDSRLKNDIKKKYIDILKSTSTREVLIFSATGCVLIDKKEVKILYEKFGLLSDLDVNERGYDYFLERFNPEIFDSKIS